MAWLSNNWIWILLGGAFLALHLFGHGGHNHRAGKRPPSEAQTREAGADADEARQDAPRHGPHGG